MPYTGCRLGYLALAGMLLAGNHVFAGEADLLEAARAGDTRRIEQLLKNKVDVNAAQTDGATALAWLVYHNRQAAAEALIRAGADVDAANDLGVTPLSLACANGNSSLVARLLEAGAEPDRARITGETPLMTCAAAGIAAGTAALIRRGADVNARENRKEQTALMWAAAAGHAEVVGLLVKHGADVDARSRVIPEPEPFIIEIPNGDSVFGLNYPESVRFPAISGGFTALHFAARQGDIESARRLIQGGADVNAPHEEYGSSLILAIASGHEDMARYLLDEGADPNASDAWGATPLHFAVHRGYLILNNYSPSRTDRFGWERHNMPGLVRNLLEKGARTEARIRYSLAYHHDPFVARSTEDPPQVDPVGATPLLLAAVSGDIEIMKILLDHGADAKAKTAGGATLFLLAAGLGAERGTRNQKQAIEAAEFALKAGGGEVNDYLTERAVDGPGANRPDGRTALHAAVLHGWKDMIRFLVDEGADIEARDRYGMTPMLYALGDPKGLYYRQIGSGNYDIRYRRPRNEGEGENDLSRLLAELGAETYSGTYRDRSGE